jgi:steroid 5-alpha reductase family enzyme
VSFTRAPEEFMSRSVRGHIVEDSGGVERVRHPKFLGYTRFWWSFKVFQVLDTHGSTDGVAGMES